MWISTEQSAWQQSQIKDFFFKTPSNYYPHATRSHAPAVRLQLPDCQCDQSWKYPSSLSIFQPFIFFNSLQNGRKISVSLTGWLLICPWASSLPATSLLARAGRQHTATQKNKNLQFQVGLKLVLLLKDYVTWIYNQGHTVHLPISKLGWSPRSWAPLLSVALGGQFISSSMGTPGSWYCS